MNEFSLYYTNKTNPNDNNYRNIMGSISINKMIRMKRNEEGERRLEGEEIEIRDGKCCEFID